MERRTLTERVESLEHKVEPLLTLPERMTALEHEVAALRTEMRAEFAAARADIRSSEDETRRFMRVLHEDVVERIEILGEGSNGTPRRRRRH